MKKLQDPVSPGNDRVKTAVDTKVDLLVLWLDQVDERSFKGSLYSFLRSV